MTNRAGNYAYDPVGNRQAVGDNGTNTGYTANALNQYTAVASDTPSYDQNGNLTGTAGWSYTYDAQNRLIAAGNGSTSVSFSYDARNRCVKRIANGVTTYLLYDGWSLIEERDAGDSLLATYFHGAVIDELLLFVDNTLYDGDNRRYYHHDGLGSTIALTHSDGSIYRSYTYDVYGTASEFDADGSPLTTLPITRFLFTGREYLADLGLYDYRNRFYSPSLGRFLQTDPIGFDGGDSNFDKYVDNSPVVLIDPLGLVPA